VPHIGVRLSELIEMKGIAFERGCRQLWRPISSGERDKCTTESKNAVHDIVVEGQGIEGAHRGECNGREKTAMAVQINQSL
jgi:hypothetical protein